MKKTKTLGMVLMLGAALLLGACGSGSGSSSSGGADKTVANKDKPVVWYNRQPSNSTDGKLDMAALTFNKDTYYVGFDANQGAKVQGEMIKSYIEKNIATVDRNGDGTIGYVLAIGDVGHNDSIARTRGVRAALGTAVKKGGNVDSTPTGMNSDGKSKVVKDGSLSVGGKTYKIRELASQEMKNNSGATWDAATAGNTIGTWSSSLGKQIDIVASNKRRHGHGDVQRLVQGKQSTDFRLRRELRCSGSHCRRIRRDHQPARRRASLPDFAGSAQCAGRRQEGHRDRY